MNEAAPAIRRGRYSVV